jgi:hypothetical protein
MDWRTDVDCGEIGKPFPDTLFLATILQEIFLIRIDFLQKFQE